MKTRTASLQVAHQKTCPSFGRAGLDSLDGCNCKPSYFTFYRDSSGRIVRGDDGTGELVGRTRRRRDGERWLERLKARIEEGAGDPNRRQSIAFPAWVAEYEAGLAKRVQRGKLKARTVRDYADTLAQGKEAFGHADLREIDARHLERFVSLYEARAAARDADLSDATIGRALRELGACLTEAVDAGYLERNPVGPFKKKLELDTHGRGKDPFTDAELVKLWAVLARRDEHGQPADGGADRIYLHLFRVAVATGARLGELLALDWDDVSMSEKRMRIRHTFNVTDGLTAPKTKGSLRTVFLTPAAVNEFEAMAATRSSGTVFVGPHGERLNQRYVGVVIGRARDKAGIPTLGESGLPRSFHSFRSTFDRRALAQGLHPEFVRASLGHSGLELTLNHYGKWSAADMAAEAAKAATDL